MTQKNYNMTFILYNKPKFDSEVTMKKKNNIKYLLFFFQVSEPHI